MIWIIKDLSWTKLPNDIVSCVVDLQRKAYLFDITHPRDWYTITTEQVVKFKGGWSILNKYNSSLYKGLYY
jgi:hypothetical protein